MTFDPDAAAQPGSGIFGLSHTREQARVVVVPVPYEATTSYRTGTADGPEAILGASAQVDLFDRRFGRIYERGIHMSPPPDWIRRLSDQTRLTSAPLIAAGGAGPADTDAAARVDAAGLQVSRYVHAEAVAILVTVRSPQSSAESTGTVGAIRPVPSAPRDGHPADRRPPRPARAIRGLSETSHASIMHRVSSASPSLPPRPGRHPHFGEREWEFARSHAHPILRKGPRLRR